MDNELNIDKNKKCISIYIDNQGVRFPCNHPAIENDNYCIFHSSDIVRKKDTFLKTLEILIKRIEKDKSISCYDFKGFYFPKISFKNKTFLKELDLRGVTFSDGADFENCEFRGEVICHKTKFKGKAFFQGSIFQSNASFVSTEFDKLILIGGSSQNKLVFHGCKFFDNAVFQGRSFLSKVVFHSSIFYKDADFQRVKFQNKVDIQNTKFEQRVIFTSAQFFDEIILSGSDISQLKNINSSGINFSGSVLHLTNFYDTSELSNYNFTNAFLISCDLSNKYILNCDFTGATLKAIHTENLRLDDKTCELTKYIFTDYEIVEEIDSGYTYEKYLPISNSRIPLQGNFGDSDNPSFTLREYLKESHKWIFLLDLPPDIRTGIRNYINFFEDFIKSTENYDVDIATMPEGEKTRITILTRDEENIEKIIYLFRIYIKNIFEPFNKIQIEFRNNEIDDFNKKRFLINYENELHTVQIRLQNSLQNLSDFKRTSSTFQLLLQEKDKHIDNLNNLLTQFVNKEPTPQNITVNVNQDVSLTNVNEIDLGLSELLDELEKSQKDINTHLIESLIEEIKEIKSELKNPKQVEAAKSRTKKVINMLGKLADYTIKNYDNISKIGESLSKMF
jgi:uncharacterized protein YjbI with pentapeptide repeats